MSKCLYSIFCDDIRQESGNKFSLMGIYNKDIQIKQLPAKKPSLFFFQNWDLDEVGKFKMRAKFPKAKVEEREFPADTIGPSSLAVGFNNVELHEGIIEIEVTFKSESDKEERGNGSLEVKQQEPS